IILHRFDMYGVSLAAGACVLSLYTKQSAIAAPAVIFVYLMVKNRRYALYFALVIGLIGGDIFLLLTLSSGGQFYFQTIRDNVQAYSWRALAGYWKVFVGVHPIMVLLLAGFVVLSIRRHKFISLPLFYLIASGIMTWTVGRTGASISYFLEFIA